MKIAVRHYGQGDHINGFGGGEQRWTANLAHFLRTEGHRVVRCDEGQEGSDCDVFFDASWERCQYVVAKKHVHFSFFGPNRGAKEISECMRSGECNLAGPYRTAYNNLIKWSKTEKCNPFLIPQPYPDDLLPAPASDHPG